MASMILMEITRLKRVGLISERWSAVADAVCRGGPDLWLSLNLSPDWWNAAPTPVF